MMYVTNCVFCVENKWLVISTITECVDLSETQHRFLRSTGVYFTLELVSWHILLKNAFRVIVLGYCHQLW